MKRSIRTVIVSAAMAIVASSSAVLASPPATIPADCDLCVDQCTDMYWKCNEGCPPEHTWAADQCGVSSCDAKELLICVAVGPG